MAKATVSACLLLGAALLACGGKREAKPPTSVSLHAEAQAILAMRGPRYTGAQEKADALRFIKSDVEPWVVQRKAATNALIAKYERARSDLSPGPGVASLYGDVAQLLYDFCRELNEVGASSATSAMRANPAAYRAYLGALATAVVPELDRAIAEAEKCLATAQPGESSLSARCHATRRAATQLRGSALPGVHGLDGAVRL